MSVSKKNNQKLISIVIATYNCGQKIENTLRSILSQNKDLFELIIIDGASTDDTLDYIKKYKEHLTLISEKDGGVYYAFNKAVDLANGEYIYFIGAGDCLKQDILEKVKEFLTSESPAFIYGKCYFMKHKTLNGKKFTSELFIRDNLCQQGIFYHHKIFEFIGKFDTRYRAFADWLFNLKCFLSSEIRKQYINYVIADYEEGGITSEIKNDPVFLKEFPHFVRKTFGIRKYLVCKLFLKFPYAFNYIYYSKYESLIRHWIYNYSLPGYLAYLIKPIFNTYKSFRNSCKN